MNVSSSVYERMPASVQPFLKSAYYSTIQTQQKLVRGIHPGKTTESRLHSGFVDEFFESEEVYQSYVSEFDEGNVSEIRDKALQQYQRMTGEKGLAGIDLRTARDYYAIIRQMKPEVIVETGVCNGISTLSLLLAMNENDTGILYSIDYPLRADESLEEFYTETFDNYGGASIPSDTDPGWIIPEHLRTRWDLTIGKSQRELPRVLMEVGPIDVFIHDSEHSHPCMMFEYELAYEWLRDDGVLLSDDIDWNTAFPTFVETRNPRSGKLAPDVGYAVKSKPE